jgi:hypothetical protein
MSMAVDIAPVRQGLKLNLSLIVIVGLVFLAIIARALPGPRTIDDAFITFRYSRNLVEGQGFVYNPGVQALGTTTPLYALTMAAIGAVTGGQDFQHYAIALSALADSVTVVLLFLLARRLTGNQWAGALLGALWAVAPRSVTFAIGGMETSVNILWMVAATSAYVLLPDTQRKDILIGILAGLGIFTRVDSGLWVALLFAYQLFDSWRLTPDQPLLSRIPWRTWLACAVTIAPWFIFSAFYFGSPIPRTLSAKTVAYIMPPGSALVTFIQTYSTPFFEFDTFGSTGAMAGSAVYLALSVIGLLYTRKHQPRLLPFLLYPWYLAPPIPPLMLGILAGAWAIIDGVKKSAKARYFAPAALAGLSVLWLGMSLNAWKLHPDHGPDRPAPGMAWHKIELLYQQIGTQLREEYGVTAETRVGSADIGAVGYFSRATIVDTVGLVTPELSRYYPISPDLIAPGQNYAIPPQLILDTDPAFLVTMEGFVRLGLEQNAEFKDEYELVENIPTDFYGDGMYLYQRVDNP